MSKRREISISNLPWVDIFTEPNFSGHLYRLRTTLEGGCAIYRDADLPIIGSVIVGPDATAHFEGHGKADSVTLLSRTILPDTSHFANRRPLSLHVASNASRID